MEPTIPGPSFPTWWPGTNIEKILAHLGVINNSGLSLNEEAVTSILGYGLFQGTREFGQAPAFGEAKVTPTALL
jgi:hypothetical protein